MLEVPKPLSAFRSFDNPRRDLIRAPIRSKSMLSLLFAKTKASKPKKTYVHWWVSTWCVKILTWTRLGFHFSIVSSAHDLVNQCMYMRYFKLLLMCTCTTNLWLLHDVAFDSAFVGWRKVACINSSSYIYAKIPCLYVQFLTDCYLMMCSLDYVSFVVNCTFVY